MAFCDGSIYKRLDFEKLVGQIINPNVLVQSTVSFYCSVVVSSELFLMD
jgi:hypothetical protein